MSDVNYLLTPFEGNINPVYLTGVKLYLQATKDIDKETEKLDISVSNAKDIVYYFLSLAKKYVWGRLSCMVNSGTVSHASTERAVIYIYIFNLPT